MGFTHIWDHGMEVFDIRLVVMDGIIYIELANVLMVKR